MLKQISRKRKSFSFSDIRIGFRPITLTESTLILYFERTFIDLTPYFNSDFICIVFLSFAYLSVPLVLSWGVSRKSARPYWI